MIRALTFSLLAFLSTTNANAFAAQSGKYFDRAVIVIFENTDYSLAIQQPFFAQLASQGQSLSDFRGLAHPSQPNYLALTSGSTQGVRNNGNVTLNVRSIVDLLEAKGLTWKVYAEDYPGNCFLGASNRGYARKHNPFISYMNVQNDSTRCANIVNADEFDRDVAAHTLPNYVFYIPNDKNDGHDTGVQYADHWYEQKFAGLLADTNFMNRTVLISTFDEDSGSRRNQIYTSIVGPNVNAGSQSGTLYLYSLLRLMEDNWDLGNLGQEDATTKPITGIWKSTASR